MGQIPQYWNLIKSGHRKEIGGGVWTHAGFSKIQHKYKENKTFRTFYKILSKESKTFRTFYKILSQACRGDPPAGEENFVECSECLIFLVFMLHFAETGMCPDTSANFFPVAAFSNGVFDSWPYVGKTLIGWRFSKEKRSKRRKGQTKQNSF